MNLLHFFQPALTPSDSPREGLDIWRERALSMILTLAGIGGTIVYIINMPTLIRKSDWLQIAIFTAVYLWLLIITLARRLSFNFRAGSLMSILYLLGTTTSSQGMLMSDGRTWLGGFTILMAILFGLRAGLWAAIGSAATLLVIGLLFKMQIIPMPTVYDLVQSDNLGIWVNTTAVFLLVNITIVTILVWLINNMNKNLSRMSSLSSEMEHRGVQLQRQTQALERHSRAQEASARVNQAVSSILDPDLLIRQVVDLIREQFDLYYVGFLRMDKIGKWAVLQAGTSEAGEIMLARGHRVKVGEGIIGGSIANAQARTATEARGNAAPLTTPELPETRSEAAIPLRSRGQVLGALIVQSTRFRTFDDALIATLQIMADQVAVALDNARLFAESQAALETSRRAYGELSQEAWGQFLREQPDLGFLSTTEVDVTPAGGNWTPEMQQAARTGDIARTDGRTLAIPIVLRDQVLGVVRLCKPEDGGQWTDDEVELMNTLIDQLEAALESARLYQDTQRRAAREQMVTQITTKIRATTDPQVMLQTAVSELREALQAQRAQVVIRTEGKD